MISIDIKIDVKPEDLVEWGPENCCKFFAALGEMLRSKGLGEITAAKTDKKKLHEEWERLLETGKQFLEKMEQGNTDLLPVVGHTDESDTEQSNQKRCRRCRGVGHNSATCSEPIAVGAEA